jgi:hypothetical protein
MLLYLITFNHSPDRIMEDWVEADSPHAAACSALHEQIRWDPESKDQINGDVLVFSIDDPRYHESVVLAAHFKAEGIFADIEELESSFAK